DGLPRRAVIAVREEEARGGLPYRRPRAHHARLLAATDRRRGLLHPRGVVPAGRSPRWPARPISPSPGPCQFCTHECINLPDGVRSQDDDPGCLEWGAHRNAAHEATEETVAAARSQGSGTTTDVESGSAPHSRPNAPGAEATAAPPAAARPPGGGSPAHVGSGSAPHSRPSAPGPASPRTRALLTCGIVAGPFYLGLGIIQGLVREGFDFGRHPLSVLANGPGGWVQTLNFVLTGAMVLAAALGFARVLRPPSRVVGWVLALCGIGMLGAAVFRADPVDGFPPGTPEGMPATVSTSGILHFAFGGITFLALAISCIVAARAFSRRGDSVPARRSLLAGVAVLFGFFSPFFLPMTGSVAGIWFAVIVGWAWLAYASLHLRRSVSG